MSQVTDRAPTSESSLIFLIENRASNTSFSEFGRESEKSINRCPRDQGHQDDGWTEDGMYMYVDDDAEK